MVCFVSRSSKSYIEMFFFQEEDGIQDIGVTGVQTCALPIYDGRRAVADADRIAQHRRDLGGGRRARPRGEDDHGEEHGAPEGRRRRPRATRPAARGGGGSGEGRVGEKWRIRGSPSHLKKKHK